MCKQGPKAFLIGSALMLAISPVWAQSSGSGASGGSTSSSAGPASRGPAARSGAATSTAPLATTSPGATGTATAPSTTAPSAAGSSAGTTTPNPGRLDSASPTDPDLTPRSVPSAGTPAGQALGTTPLKPNSTGTDSTVPLSTDNSRTPAGAAGSGGRPVMGARGNTLEECMATWDAETHVSKPRWREICARTLKEPHL
jgi:hypothetical protein